MSAECTHTASRSAPSSRPPRACATRSHHAPRVRRACLRAHATLAPRGATPAARTRAREQVALARSLPAFLQTAPRVRLIVIDSVAFHFRHGFDDYAARTRTLLAHALQLLRVAVQYELAVVLINQVTTKVAHGGSGGGGGGGGSGMGGAGAEPEGASVIAPALGETWAHVSNTRIVLSKGLVCGELERSALVDKSATTPRTSVPFLVSAEGVRSVRRRPAKRALEAAGGAGVDPAEC